MKIRIEVVGTNINAKQIASRVKNDAGFWTFAATEWHRLYAPYVPRREGALEETVKFNPGEIIHTMPYAHYQYNGTNFHFYKGQNPKATAQWDKAAEATQLPKLCSTMQAYVDQGRLKL